MIYFDKITLNDVFCLLFFLLINSFFGYAQTGPGGVGASDGTSSLAIWLRSDDVDADGGIADNPINGAAISQWSDASGNNNNFNQTGANRPSYNTTGAFNAVNFNSSLATPQFMNGTIAGSFSNASTYFVLNPVNTGNSHSLFDNTTISLRVEQWFNTGRVGITRYGVADYATTIGSPFNQNSIISYHKTGGSANVDVRVNGVTQVLNIGSAAAGLPYDRIGRNSTGADEASGDFFEVILYNNSLNTAQTIIVDNYLSAKYASISIPVNVYNEDDVAAGNYDFDVAGIGRMNASNLHTDAQGTGIVRILNPGNLNNNEFLMWGHDNGSLLFNNSTDIPAKIVNRLDRVWRISEVNTSGAAVDVGSVDVRFDLTGLGTITASDLRLLVDTDNDGVFNDETPIINAVSLGSNVYGFIGVTSFSDNVRYTLAIGMRTVITNRNITYRVDN
ncbi:hypothetical protein [Aquimarina sp. 2201CG5-10]|uniref:hypothetical protein n=1 Tax=Aquimarina callyspongiae TaxID=3098150 RepID=UPI002AB42206|nr:hypothetical protein [Aquimarina sp. 2201CG5-10]MDY8136367.1 hypothetical protein [Aquimarina sp. 2201CG5-10]